METEIFIRHRTYAAIVRGPNWKIQWLNEGYQSLVGTAQTHEQAIEAARSKIDTIVEINARPRD
ncbi:hypothetical protein [Microcoleus sp. F4-D5]|uniref:hypothetical protein n=1 Tax=Microcoleus sp. F4-D5 TaxID=2818760 RepID=UPI002FD3FDF0